MIRAIVRPEKVDETLKALMYAGFPSVTKMEVYGRGKQRGMKMGAITYDELPKEMIFSVIEDKDKDFVIQTIMRSARSGDKGAHGDGKVFVQAVNEAWTIRTGTAEL